MNRLWDWLLLMRIRRAEKALKTVPRHEYREAWNRAARLHLARRDLDDQVRVHLEAMLERGGR